MAGVFTDNQPDFTWLAPYEEKAFVQNFLPYSGLGRVHNASATLAIKLERADVRLQIGVYAVAALNVGYSGWNGRATIEHGAMTVTLLAQTNWLMLFRMPGEPFICLEPQSHPVNAHNLPGHPGLVMLNKGESWRFSTSILVNSLIKC